jgi:hypothetical protein
MTFADFFQNLPCPEAGAKAFIIRSMVVFDIFQLFTREMFFSSSDDLGFEIFRWNELGNREQITISLIWTTTDGK